MFKFKVFQSFLADFLAALFFSTDFFSTLFFSTLFFSDLALDLAVLALAVDFLAGVVSLEADYLVFTLEVDLGVLFFSGYGDFETDLLLAGDLDLDLETDLSVFSVDFLAETIFLFNV
jgi:hypothetical protein